MSTLSVTDDLDAIGNEILDLLDGERGVAKSAAFFDRSIYHVPQRELVAAIADTSPDAARLITELASRQSGKSFGAGGGALELAFGSPGCNIVYVAATFDSCERMGFKPAKSLAEDHELGCRFVDMQIVVPGGCTIYFLGANTEKFIDRLRGIPNLVAAVIDECGIYKSADLRAMIETVVPGLRPRRGKLVLMGTPSKAGKLGTWYASIVAKGWLHLVMSYRDNDRVPSFADVEKLIDEELEALFPNMTPDQRRKTAYFLREYGDERGPQFVVDATEKVYELTDANLVDVLPPGPWANRVTGGDLGETANDALLTFAWNDDGSPPVLVEEKYARGQDSVEFAQMAKDVFTRWTPDDMPIDPGGLGVKTINTARGLFPELPLTEARKGPVTLQVRAFNTLLRRGLLMLRTSRLATDLSTPTWEISKDGVKTINEHGSHSDGAPAARYAAQVIVPRLPAIPDERTEAEAAAEARLEYLRAIQRRQKRAGSPILPDDDDEAIAAVFGDDDDVPTGLPGDDD